MEPICLKTLEDAQRFFANDIYATETSGCVIKEASPGFARCEMPIEARHKNAAGQVMGGAIFTLADFSFAVAAAMTGTPAVSLTSQISYLSTAKGSKLIATAQQVKAGKQTCYYRVTVADDTGRMVAEAVTNGFAVRFDA